MTTAVGWNELSYFELRSCATKKRFSCEPPLPNMMFRAYACSVCGGWHLATKKKYQKLRRQPSPDPRLHTAAHDGRAVDQASARDGQKAAARDNAAVGRAPAKGRHIPSKRRKPSPIQSWTHERVTEAKIGDRKVRIFWPEPAP